MKEIIVIGAGGHAAEIDEYLLHKQLDLEPNKLKILGFIDDNSDNYKNYKFSAPFLGAIKNHSVDKNLYYIIGIANLAYRKPIVTRFLNEGAQFLTFIHPTACVSPSAKIGIGVVIAPFVNVGPNVQIGDFTLINARASMGHDTTVGEHNFITPNVCFSGFTHIGDENLFGVNSATIPGISVGSRNKIAAGMILDKNVEDDSIIFHRFKEKVIAIPK